MSAWIVSKKHIDALVTAYLHSQHFDKQRTSEENNQLGQMLWHENHQSVNCRYNERKVTPNYKFSSCSSCVNGDGTRTKLSTVALFKLVNCYMYQTSEHGGWTESKAYEFCNNLRERLAAKLGVKVDEVYKLPEYDAAPWGI
jgi:hypothetical protein